LLSGNSSTPIESVHLAASSIAARTGSAIVASNS
jgi:hypothetical protein